MGCPYHIKCSQCSAVGAIPKLPMSGKLHVVAVVVLVGLVVVQAAHQKGVLDGSLVPWDASAISSQYAYVPQQSGHRRAAVCFFGLPRSLEYTKESIRGTILDTLIKTGWKYDVYLHTYNQSSINNHRSREVDVQLDVDAWKLLQPKRFIVEDPAPVRRRISSELQDYLPHGDPWREERHQHSSMKNLLLQLHSIQQVTSLWQESDYDVVLYLRPDMWYFNAPNMTEFNAASDEPGRIYVPAFAWWGPDAVNDRIAFGHPKAMKVYGNRVQHAKSYAQAQKLHAETFLKYVLVSNNIEIKKTGLLASRVRATGMLWGIPMLNVTKGTWDFPGPTFTHNQYYMYKTQLLGTWTASRCNGTLKNGSRC